MTVIHRYDLDTGAFEANSLRNYWDFSISPYKFSNLAVSPDCLHAVAGNGNDYGNGVSSVLDFHR